jgi:hypothetical protein
VTTDIQSIINGELHIKRHPYDDVYNKTLQINVRQNRKGNHEWAEKVAPLSIQHT